MPYRLFVTTHHITSRAKIQRLTQAAMELQVSVLIKRTIKPPGMMICEGDSEKSAHEWLSIVKRLRYKGYRLVVESNSSGPRILNGSKDGVKVVDGTEEFISELQNLSKNGQTPSIEDWWRSAMRLQNS